MEKTVTEEYSNEKKKKKKGLWWKIILIVLGCILLVAVGTCATFYFKARAMSKNAVKVIEEMLYVPDEFPEVPTLIEIDPPDYIPDGNDPDPRLDDPDLYPDDDPEYDPNDPYYWPEPYDPGDGSGGYNPTPIYNTSDIDRDVINILIIGTDRRSEKENGRSDTMMLLSYNKKTRSAKIVSFLRDCYVYIPGKNRWNRLNAAYSWGGPGMLINTINYNFGLDIKRYIRVDFNGVVSLVDAVGGLDVELTVREIQYINSGVRDVPKIPLEAGVHHLNGKQVLRHARNRRVGSVDWSRTERQRKLMYSLLERAKQEPNPVTLMSLLYQLTDKLDTNMSADDMVNLAVDVVFGGSFSMGNAACPFKGTWNYAWEGSMAVIHIDIAANKAKLKQFLYGK
ncbi:MAG: LCP family protein [Clostridia bacterium]|nr:LCP family protein [Clostridia bacterium]